MPNSLQREAKENREAWQLANPLTGARPGSPARTVTTRSIPGAPRPTYGEKWQATTGASVDHVEASLGDQLPSEEVLLSGEAENDSGGNNRQLSFPK
jgi:hypothetical protein